MSLLVWELEWQVALRRRRLFVLNLAIPLLLVVPIALSGAPAVHAAAVYTVLFTLFATFGSAIPLIRDGEDGLLSRFALAGIAPRAFLLQRVAAQAVLDTVQLALPLLVVVVAAPGPWTDGAALLPRALLVLFLALLLANVLGACVAALARSVAEGALFAAVSALLLLHGAGTFRTPAPGSPAALAAELVPFSGLHRTMLEAAGGGAGTVGFAGLAVGAPVAVALLLLFARPVLERIAAAERAG
jgi:hypothetical protein